MITSTNTELVFAEGVTLALINSEGLILRQGKSVEKEVFEAVTDKVARHVVFSGVKLSLPQ